MSEHFSNGHSKDHLSAIEQTLQSRTLYNAVQGQDILNAFHSYQRKMFKMFLDQRRDIGQECGYPDTDEITPIDYYSLYEREPVAERVVSIYPQESWQVSPLVYEDENPTEETDFEAALQEIARKLDPDDALPAGSDTKDRKQAKMEGFYIGDEGNPLWEALQRIDRLCGIGHFGGLLLGLGDGKELIEPADLKRAGKPGIDLLYVRPLDETVCEVGQLETDKSSRRYGRPVTYRVTISSPYHGSTGHRRSADYRTGEQVDVHWTRIVHVVDTLDASEVYHVPRMRTVYNRLYDLHKLYGGSAEMYWKAAFFGLAFETHPQLGGEVSVDADDMKEQMERYENSLQRYMALPGMSAKVLSPSVVDPGSHIDTQITAICINKGIPKRVFMGSERGELSSSQDLRTWMGVIKARQDRVCTPRILVPFVRRLINAGVLPQPKQFNIDWPDIASLTKSEKAQVATQRTQAMATYVSGNVEAIMPFEIWLTKEMDYTQEEALEIVKLLQEGDEEGTERITPDPEQQRKEQLEAQQKAQEEQAKALQQQQGQQGSQPPNGPQKPPQDSEQSAEGNLAKQQGKAQEKRDEAVTKNVGQDVQNNPWFDPNQLRGPDGQWIKQGADTGGDYGSGRKQYQQSMRGEYWLQGSFAQSADGNVDDMNHVGYAIQEAQLEIIGSLGLEIDTDSLGVDIDQLYSSINELEEEHGDNLAKYLAEHDVSEELLDVALDRGSMDPRQYAVEQWGWTRVAGNSVQTDAVNRSKLQEIADGLYDAYQDAVEDQSFDIETKKDFYVDVPFPVISEGDMSALRDYKQHGTSGWGGNVTNSNVEEFQQVHNKRGSKLAKTKGNELKLDNKFWDDLEAELVKDKK